MRSFKATILFLALLSFSSCVQTRMTSNKAEWYGGKLTKTYIIINSVKPMETYSLALGDQLNSSLLSKNIISEYHVRDPLSLESDKDIEKRIQKYSPSQLIIFNQTAITSGSGIHGGTYEVQIIKADNKRIIWKGYLSTYSQFPVSLRIFRDKSVRKNLEKLIEKWQEDGLI